MKAVPTMRECMTAFPYAIDADRSVADAARMMEERRIRHLPVTFNGEVYSVITQRDIRALMDDPKGDPERMKVKSLSVIDPYIATTDEYLDVVLWEMAERRVGCAVIVEGDRVAGIYTTVDACRQFCEYLRS